MTITSSDNPALKEIRRLRGAAARTRSGLFVAEGEDLLAAADANGWEPVRRLRASDTDLPGEPVAADLLNDVSTLSSGVRTLAVYRSEFRKVPALGVRVHLHGLRDPGNVGTILRSAHALGATGVTLGPDTADPFGPKAVRASMGAIFALPVERIEDPISLEGEKVALMSHGEALPNGPLEHGGVLLVGSEREGLPAEIAKAADRCWTIPTVAGAESLNASAALAIALHVANRIPPE